MITGKEDLIGAMLEAYSMEKGTKDFYAFAANHVSSDSAREIFSKLSEWEEDHIHYIEHLYHSFQEDRESLTFEDFSSGLEATHIESGVPVEEAKKVFEEREITSDREALRLALEIEAKAYSFYKKLSDTTEDNRAKVLFGEMVVQEQKHIQYLSSLKKEIDQK